MVTKQDGQLVRHRRGAMTMNLSPGWAKAALHSIVIDLTSRQCRVVISVRNLFDGMDAHTKNRLTFFAMMAALLLGGCGTSQPMQRGNGSSEYLDAVSRLSPGQAHDITIYAIGLVGTPYRFGGNTPDSGFDCSGLIGHVYKTRAEISPPRIW
jgi:cell wall-associated NlpC family hydrolase